jgi:hypothetical protein
MKGGLFLMEAKLKHLEFIQTVIARMSNCSFAFKGWSITITGALLAFAVTNDKTPLVLVALYSTLLFWGLDGYYLWLERRFIELYKKVAKLPDDKIDFSMDIDKSNAFGRWLETCARPHLVMFYGIIVFIEIIATIVVRKG